MAALAAMQAWNYSGIEAIGLKTEYAAKAVALLRESSQAWPELGSGYELVGQLFTLALFVWRGAGPLSLDHLVRLDSESEPEIL